MRGGGAVEVHKGATLPIKAVSPSVSHPCLNTLQEDLLTAKSRNKQKQLLPFNTGNVNTGS